MRASRLRTSNLLVFQAMLLLLVALVVVPRVARAEEGDVSEPVTLETEELEPFVAEDPATEDAADYESSNTDDYDSADTDDYDSANTDDYDSTEIEDYVTVEPDAPQDANDEASLLFLPEEYPADLLLSAQDGDSSDAVTVKNVRLYGLDGTEKTLSGDYDCQKRCVIVGRPGCYNTVNMVGQALSISAYDEFSDISFLVLDVDGKRDTFEEGFASYETERVRFFSSDNSAYREWVWWAYAAMGNEGGSVTLPFIVLIDKSNHVQAVVTGPTSLSTLCRTYLSSNESHPDPVDPGDPGQFDPEEPEDPTVYDGLSFSVWGHADMRSGRDLLPLVNEARAAVGAPPLTWDEELEQTALQRGAEQMVLYSHTRPDGTKCYTAWPSSQKSYAGENIAMSQTNVSQVNTSWTESPGHYANMIDSGFTTFAAAHFESESGVDYWVECFGGGVGSGMSSAPVMGQVQTHVDAIKGNIHVSLCATPGSYNSTIGEFIRTIPNLKTGESQQLALVAGDADIDPADVIWTSSNPSVATIDETGTVMCHSAGSTEVTAALASYPDLYVTKTITVSDEEYIAAGTWGTCPWEIDNDGTLWVYPGEGEDSESHLYSPVSYWIDYGAKIKAVRFVEQGGRKVVMPQYCNYLFGRLPNLVSADLYGMDTSQTLHLHGLFAECGSLRQVSIPSNLDTSNLADIGRMFKGCVALKSVDLSPLDTSHVSQMYYVFEGCTALKTLDVSGWNTSEVVDMDGIFMDCSSLATLDLSSWDTSSLDWSNFEFPMFKGCMSLAKLTVGDSYEVSDSRGFPDATASNGMWWSTAEQRWVSKEDILGGMLGKLDVFTDYEMSDDELPTSIEEATVSVRPQSSTFTGKAIEPTVTVTLGGTALESGTDYKISYANNTNAGTGKVMVTGKGRYVGSKAATFTIARKSIASAKIATVSKQIRTGKAIEPTPVVTDGSTILVRGTDYTLSYRNNVEAGTATITVTGKGNYTGTRTVTFEIVAHASFRDVTAATPHASDIMWLAESGISTGWTEKDGSKTFRPTNTVIRQDMAAFLFRLAKSWDLVGDDWQPTGKVTFTDVSAKTPHYREIMWLAESGVSAGWKVGSGREFRPTNTVVRQDMAAFLRRLQALRDPSVRDWQPTGASPFRDVTARTPHYDDILWLAESGVSAGWKVSGGKEFRPTSTVIRQDMAAFLHRLDNLG